ncbi:MAG TPA: AraC family transcriptional regulator [Clostridiales bacterium]|nr:AraC family transcriptional regulator [Clostridiales bacterium]
MNRFAYQERMPRGTFDFPIEFHHVDRTHPRYQMPFHWHIEYEFLLVLKGHMQLFLDEKVLNLNPGDAVLISDGVVHGAVPKDCVYQCIVLDFSRFFEDSTLSGKEIQKILNHNVKLNDYHENGSILNGLFKDLFKAMAEAQDGYEFIVKGILFQMVGLILRHRLYSETGAPSSSDRIKRFKKVLRKIRQDFAKPLSLNDLSEVLGVSPKYFCRFFKEMSGRTPIDYLNYYRIECAAEQLLSTDQSVTEIALNCGFNDLSYFIKTFKKYKGYSPRTFRHSDQTPNPPL